MRNGNYELREIEHKEEAKRKAKNQRNQTQRESKEMRKARQRFKKVCLEKCGKIEKALTKNETCSPIRKGHVAMMHATLP